MGRFFLPPALGGNLDGAVHFYCESLLFVQYLGPGSSNDPCAEDYHGSAAFSEPEIAALRDFIKSLGGGDTVAMYNDYHAYSQYWMTPFGYTETKPANYEQQVHQKSTHLSYK